MTVNKRTKKSRYRASQTHGGGAKKKRRGAGNRGGRGNAGSGKRANSKGPSYWKEDPKYFGKLGFISKSRRAKDSVLNINLLEEMLPRLIDQKVASKEKDAVVVDLGKVGYTKLLGEGSSKTKIKVTVNYASVQAIEKITKAGGEVVVAKQSSQQ